MAGDFDYSSLWEDARDVLDMLDALSIAMDQFRHLRESYSIPGLVPAFRHGKRHPQPADYAEQCEKALSAVRKAASDFFALLAEDRFVEPLANVWPPSTPGELAFQFSHALVSARSFCFATRDSDDKKLSGQKQNLYLARCGVQSVLRELERRPDLAERAYQRARDKLWRRIPKQSRSGGITDEIVVPAKVKDKTAPVAPVPKKNTGDAHAKWFHESSERRPQEYKHGPITGRKKDICRWMGEKKTPTPRRLEQKARSSVVWVIRQSHTSWEVWFKDERLWEQANRNQQFGMKND
jgi:hypothetical protein